jgi:uncharacterized membrane protein YkvA (DUF1232 family)
VQALLVVGLVLLATYVLAVLAVLAAGHRAAARALVGFVPDCAVLLTRLGRAVELRRRDRVLLLAALVYLACPLDVVPDFLPVAGQLDDAVVVALVLRRVLRAAGAERVRAAWPGPPEGLRVVLGLAGLRTAA